MSTADEIKFSEQVARYFGGECTSDELRELSARLERDAEACHLFAEILLQSAAVREYARANPQPVMPTRRAPHRSLTWLLPVSAAAALVFSAVTWMLNEHGEPIVMTAAEVRGIVRWTGHGGSVVENLAKDATLGGGSVETASDDATVTLAFSDGSLVTLMAHSTATISDDGQKRVHLRGGNLSADVQPQRDGKPMLIHTPTAVLEVLGTRFEVDSDASNTRLAVNEGRVRLTRLMDGRIAEVPAQHEAMASLSGAEIHVAPRRKPEVLWRADFATGPSGTQGRWFPSEAGKPPRIAAEPFLVQNSSRGPITIHRVGLTLPWQNRANLQIRPDTLVSVRGRTSKSATLEIMLACMKATGGYAGNWFQQREINDGEWEMKLPVSAFRQWRSDAETAPPSLLELRNIAIYTIGMDAALEVLSVEVLGTH
jgi:ferric-dicitrate binding protein FerR (iron transport regulator)